MIDRVRTFIGYREYSEGTSMVSRYSRVQAALIEEAERLAQAQYFVTGSIFYLTFQELHEVVRTNRVDNQLIRRARTRSFRIKRSRRPGCSRQMARSSPERTDATISRAALLVGLPVFRRHREGRARVVLDMAKADLELGDILGHYVYGPQLDTPVCRNRGPGDGGGGLMTMARDRSGVRAYGRRGGSSMRPADPGWQRIRVHGTDGYVEILA